MIGSFITAWKTLTIIPLPGKDSKDFSRSLIFFPLIGIFFAVCEGCVWKIGSGLFSTYPVVTAFFMMMCGIIISGGIHCDGLADFCDGFLGGKNKEQILTIMKDPRTGSFGVIALILDLGLRFVLYRILLDANAFAIIICSLVFSRSMQSFILSFSRYARKEGTAAPFLQGRNYKYLNILSILLFSIGLACLFGIFKVSILLCIPLVVTLIFMKVCHIKINGITGDCIGAISEISENIVLLTGVLLIPVNFSH